MDLSKPSNFKKNKKPKFGIKKTEATSAKPKFPAKPSKKMLGAKKFKLKDAQNKMQPKTNNFASKNFRNKNERAGSKPANNFSLAKTGQQAKEGAERIASKNSEIINSAKLKFLRASKIKKIILSLGLIVIILWIGSALNLIITKYANPKTYTEGYYFDEVNVDLDPVKSTVSGSNQILMDLLFAKLIRQGADGKYYPELATVTEDESKKNYTIKLKDGMKWSDGQPINSTDLEFSLNQYKANKSDDFAKLIKSAELKKLDDLSLSITIPEVNENVNKYLSSLITSPSHAYKKDGTNLVQVEDDVFSGPYNYSGVQVIANGLQFKLSKNKNYFNQQKVTNHKINIRILDSKQALVDDYKAGLVNASTQITKQDLGSEPKYSYKYQTSSSVFLFFNTTNIADLNLRKALAQSIDNNSVASELGHQILDSPINTNQLGGPGAAKQLPFSAEQATQSFNAAGYSLQNGKMMKADASSQLKFILLVTDDRQSKIAGEKVSAQLSSAGVLVELRVVSNQQLKDEYFKSHAYDMLIYGIDMGFNPDILSYWSSNQKNLDLNFSNLNDSKIEGSITGYTQNKDEAQKIRGLNKFSELWVAAVPAKALYQQNLVLNSNEKIDNPGQGLILDSSDYLNKIPYFKF